MGTDARLWAALKTASRLMTAFPTRAPYAFWRAASALKVFWSLRVRKEMSNASSHFVTR